MIKRSIVVLFLALLVVAACSGPPKKKPDTLVDPNDTAGQSCCCRIETDDPDDPTFTRAAIMECSSRHGSCLKTDTQCEGQPEPGTDTNTDPGSLPPTTDTPPNSF